MVPHDGTQLWYAKTAGCRATNVVLHCVQPLWPGRGEVTAAVHWPHHRFTRLTKTKTQKTPLSVPQPCALA